MIYTHIIGATSSSWQLVIVTPACLALIVLCIMWSFYTAKRRREATMSFAVLQQQPRAVLQPDPRLTYQTYQEQQIHKFYASLEQQQRRQEEQQRQAHETYQRRERQRIYASQEEQRRRLEEQRRRQEEQQLKERLAMIKTLGDLLVLTQVSLSIELQIYLPGLVTAILK